MSTARETLDQAARIEGCLGRSAPDEPVFVLCARDPQAADLVRAWARGRSHWDAGSPKVDAAYDVAAAMDRWRAEDSQP